MKKLILNTTLMLAMAVILATGCTKKIDEAYANPNADVRVPVEQLLPGIISTMGANGAGHGPYNDYRYLGKYIQNWHYHLASDVYDQMASRLIPLGSTAADQTASFFRAHYYDIGQNNMNMIKWATEEKKWDYVGVGKAIFAWSWLTLTDLQGEVILDQAFDPSRLTFTYQTQEEVYTYVRKLCHEALSYLEMTGDGVSQTNLALGDAYMYNGDVNKWKKFVYAVLARSFNHLSNKTAEYKPDSVIKYCNLAITANADNAMQKFAFVTGGVTGTANFFGPIRNNLNGTVAGSTSANRQGLYIVNLLTGVNSAFTGVTDPRAVYMLRKNANGTFRGVEKNKGQTAITVANDRPENFHGISQVTTTNTVPANDNNCRYIFRNAAPLPVITAAEVQFMKAEAAFRKGDKGTALAAYKEAISLNFDMLTTVYNANIPTGEEITQVKKDAYINNTAVVPAVAGSLTLSKIMLQKYIALYAIGVFETWTDMRRFHYTDKDPEITTIQVYTDLVIPTTAAADIHPNNLGNPVHRVYPRYNSETIWNIAELQRIGADKDDYHTKEMWFSKP